MAQSVIGSLRVNLGLDSAQFQRGARKVDAPLKRMQKQFKAVAGVVATMGAAITAAALSGARQIDATAKSARRLDASIGGFRALELAASEAGVSLSGLTNDIQTMNRELASIGTSGNGARALDALGLSIADLEGLDADEKLAVIADQVQALGLDAGQTTAILRDLGVRNREMALLVLGGGDAIRSARDDIRDYGLEVSRVDSDRIEAANDAIGRLGLITQYAGQQLAIALVPALGRMAQAMTDSLREGGLLRAVIDGLADNIDVLAYSAGVAVTAFVAYRAWIIASKIATVLFTGSLVALRTALITTGIGALIVGAGYLIAKFADLVSAAGGFGNAMTLLRDVATGVWDKIRAGGALLSGNLRVQFNDIQYAFATVVGNMSVAWARLVDQVAATALGSRLGVDGGNELAAISAMESELSELTDSLVAYQDQIAAAQSVLDAPTAGVGALRDAMADRLVAIDDAADSSDDLADRLAEIENSGASDALRAIRAEVEGINVDPMVDGLTRISDGMIDAIYQGDNLVQAFSQMLAQMALQAVKADIGGLIGGLFGGPGVTGGGAGVLGLGGARAAGGPVSAGVPYLVNENTARSEIFVPSQSGAILNVPQAQRALSGRMGQGGTPNVSVNPEIRNIIVPAERVSDYLSTPAGEQMIYNIIDARG